MKVGDMVRILPIQANNPRVHGIIGIITEINESDYDQTGYVITLYTGKDFLDYHETRLELVNEAA